MAFTTKNKRYGLTIPKSSKASAGKLGKSALIFQNDSSEEDESKNKSAINLELNAVAEKKKQTKQTKEEIERALKEDPSVYKYDEIYEEMEQKKIQITKDHRKEDKKPKYIANLLKSAAMRKKEQERRIERNVQREREKEGDEFADKESFVTGAYRQKMLEQAEEEERIRKQDELDALHDVTKQKDLSHFYRNLLNRNVAMGAGTDQVETEKPEDAKGDEKNKMSKEIRKYSLQPSTEPDEDMSLKKSLPDRVISERDEPCRKVKMSHSVKEKGSSHAGTRNRSKYSDQSDASISESDENAKQVKKSSRDERIRDKDEELRSRAYRNRKDDKRGSKRTVLESPESDDKNKGWKNRAHLDRNLHGKELRDTKDRISKVGRNNEDSSRKAISPPRKSRKKYRRRDSYSDNSSSEKEAEKVLLKSEQKSKRNMRGYNDVETQKYIEKRRNERSNSEKDNERHHSKKGKQYSDSSSDYDIREAEESSGHVRRKSRQGDSNVNERKRDMEREKSVEEKKGDIEKEAAEKERMKIYARHNDAQSISNARERYLVRKKAKIAPQTYESDSDD